MQHARTLVPSTHFYLLTMMAATAIVLLAIWPRHRASESFDTRCESADAQAGAVLASLLSDRSEIAQALFGDAVFRLKRARWYCRYGFASMAQADYDALMSNRYQIER